MPRAARINIETELAAEGLSNRAIADVLGVDHKTVNGDLRGENSPLANGEQEDVEDKSGENSPEPKSTRALLSQSDQNDWRTPRKYLDGAERDLAAYAGRIRRKPVFLHSIPGRVGKHLGDLPLVAQLAGLGAECLGGTHGTFDSIPLFAKAP
jgi:hypothetical protein